MNILLINNWIEKKEKKKRKTLPSLISPHVETSQQKKHNMALREGKGCQHMLH